MNQARKWGVAALLALTMALTLCACSTEDGQVGDNSSDGSSSSKATTTTSSSSSASTTQDSMVTLPTMSDSSEGILGDSSGTQAR